MVWTMLTLRPYLNGLTFTLRTAHEALRWLLNFADVSSRLARWSLRLAECEYDEGNRPDIKHQLADVVSRLRTNGGGDTLLDAEVPCFAVETSNNSLSQSVRSRVAGRR